MHRPTGVEIQKRLEFKRCIQCGISPAIDWPYVCHDCQRQLADEQVQQRQRLEAAAYVITTTKET